MTVNSRSAHKIRLEIARTAAKSVAVDGKPMQRANARKVEALVEGLA